MSTFQPSCESCRHSVDCGEMRLGNEVIRKMLICKLTNVFAVDPCRKYEYEPGTDAQETIAPRK